MKKEQTTSPMGDNQTQAPKSAEPTAQELASILKKCLNTKVIEDCVGCPFSGPETAEQCLEALAKAAATLIEKQEKQIDVLAKYLYIHKFAIEEMTKELECNCCSLRKNCFERERFSEKHYAGCSAMWQLSSMRCLEDFGLLKIITAEENKANLVLIEKIFVERGYFDDNN